MTISLVARLLNIGHGDNFADALSQNADFGYPVYWLALDCHHHGSDRGVALLELVVG